MSDWKAKVGGLIPQEPDPRDYRLIYKKAVLPEEYDPRDGYPVHDQGSFNNCAAHALAAYIEILLQKKGMLQEISFPWYYGDRNYTSHKGEGLISRDLLKTAQKDGGLSLSEYPWVEEMTAAMETFNQKYPDFKDRASEMKIGTYYQCATPEEVKEAIYRYGSCLIGTTLFESFGEVAMGKTLYMTEPVINGNVMEPVVGGHMMLAVGWIKDYFIVLNSWGEGFGDKGYFYLPFSLATWNQRTGFPISVFDAWAVSGVTVDGTFLTLGEGEEPPREPKGWYKTEAGKWRYRLENGEDAKGWLKVQNVWYFLDENGDMWTGWRLYDENWYYLTESGAMATGWRKVDGKWYYFKASGEAVKGFQTIGGKDYYFADRYFHDVKECQMIETDENGAIR